MAKVAGMGDSGDIPMGIIIDGKRFSMASYHTTNTKKTMFSGMNKMLAIVTISSCLGCSIPAGFNIGVLNAPQTIIQQFCNNTISAKYNRLVTQTELDFLWSWIVSIFVVGGMCGAGIAGWICNLMGRRRSLLFNQLFGIASAAILVTSKFAESIEMIFVGRFLAGFHCGYTFNIVPVYLTEISPVSLRGALGVIHQLGLNAGVCLSQILGLKYALGSEESWHYLLGSFVIPIVIFSIILYFCPESPKFLFIVKEQQAAALTELSRLRGLPATQLHEDVLELRESMKLHLAEPNWSLWKLICSRELRLPLLLVCTLQAAQQLSGINIVFYFSTSIFMGAGISEENSQYASICAGFINTVMGTLAMVFVSKFTRRKLLTISFSGCIFFLLLLTLALKLQTELNWMAYVAVVALLSFVLSYGLGLGPIPFFIGTELFQQGPKPAAISIGGWLNWTLNFIVGSTFVLLNSAIGAFCFLIFAISLTAALGFIRWKLPETKDKDIMETSKYFQDKYREDRGILHITTGENVNSKADFV